MGGLGEGTGVLYLDTERKFSAERLVEIARNQAPEWCAATMHLEYSVRRTALVDTYFMADEHDLIHRYGIDEDGEDNSNETGGSIFAARIDNLMRRTLVLEIDESRDLLARSLNCFFDRV